MLLLTLFIVVPIVEIALFIEVGGLIGLWPTIACVVLTAIIGTTLLRLQGLQVLQQMQTSLQAQRFPVDAVVHGGFLLVSGLLLLTPGFFTDAVGFALLIPPVRLIAARFIWSRLKNKVTVSMHGDGAGTGSERDRNTRPGAVIEGEAHEVTESQDGDDSGAPNGGPGNNGSPRRQ